MGLFSKIAEGLPRRLGVALTGIASMWGIRTPPDPDVIAHMQPAKGPEGSSGGEGRPSEVANRLVMPGARYDTGDDEQ
ncbi:MAG: hypothetical protein ACO1SX_15305 [Actinomycetota bacterium]